MSTATTWAVVAYMRSLTSLPPAAAARADSEEAAYLDRRDSARTLTARLAVPLPTGETRP
jgi:hypothetical protein